MSDLIKYANTDILDSLKGIKAGLNNIVSHVANTGESYTIDIPLKWTTVVDLLYYAIPDVSLDYNYFSTDINYHISVGNCCIELTKDKNGYKFTRI